MWLINLRKPDNWNNVIFNKCCNKSFENLNHIYHQGINIQYMEISLANYVTEFLLLDTTFIIKNRNPLRTHLPF